jgi:hypothetical protein
VLRHLSSEFPQVCPPRRLGIGDSIAQQREGVAHEQFEADVFGVPWFRVAL